MNDRRAIFLTARRELRERARSRAFVFSTAIQIAIVVAIVVVSALTGDDADTFKLGTVGDSSAPVVEAAEAQQDAFGAKLTVKSYDDEEAAQAAVSDDEVDAALVGDTLFTGTDPSETLVALIQQATRELEGTEALRSKGLSDEEIQTALSPKPLTVTPLGEESGSAVAFLSSLLLYVAIIGSGYAVATGVVEEKSSRVVEVILAAIKPVQLLAGKVIGIGILSLGQLLLIVLAGLVAAIPVGAVDLPDSTASTAALIAVYFVLGYLVYACAFAVTGALVSRQEDVQSSSGPLTLILVAAYLIGISASDNPEGTLAVVATFIPPLAPMIVPARAAQDALPLAQLAGSLVLMVLAAVALLWLAARIYNRAVLKMGAPIKIRDALQIRS